jgi:hypothetical protein
VHGSHQRLFLVRGVVLSVCAVASVSLQEQKEVAYVDMDKSNEEKEAGNTGEAGSKTSSAQGNTACRGWLRCLCGTLRQPVLPAPMHMLAPCQSMHVGVSYS